MDSSRARSPTSPPPEEASDHFSPQHAYNFDTQDDIFISDLSPTRQQRRLQSRNARFPAKKLSISSLSSKLTQLIGNNDSSSEVVAPSRNQENKLHKSKSTGTIAKRNLSILEEISNAARGRPSKEQSGISIYQDPPERPLLDASPPTSSPYIDDKADFTSPSGFDHIHDSLNTMRLRDSSLNHVWSPSINSTKMKTRRRSAQAHFDADEYIEHIEKELQQAREEAYSPLTRRPMKEKLRAAYKENERLLQEVAHLRERFETEVKRTVEHKTLTEVELRRRVRDLESVVEEKDDTIREMQSQHEERRLDTNVIESLRATIDRLELEKQDMEEVNLSMNKRNEVLTQLLAMSPTKTTNFFNMASPVREKSNRRPISLILPRNPTSPRQSSHASSIACSPHQLSSANISPLKLSPVSSHGDGPDAGRWMADQIQQDQNWQQNDRTLRSPMLQETVSRRWTILSDTSLASATGLDDSRPVPRRKARKFVAGSTQLKPLLLPALAGDSMPSASTASSPLVWPSRASSEINGDETVLPIDSLDDAQQESESSPSDDYFTRVEHEGPGPAFETSPPTVEDAPEIAGLPASVTVFRRPRLPRVGPESAQTLHMACSSLQTVPMPSTPDSLAAFPQPLFSPARHDLSPNISNHSSKSNSPVGGPMDRIHLRKRRTMSIGSLDLESPAAKIPRHMKRHSSVHHMSEASISSRSDFRDGPRRSRQDILHQLRHARSSDNFMEVLRARNFAVKPLAAMTIKTVYKILTTCTSAVRELRSDPFALARRVLANAWHMNWDILGKLSWWVLGLFIHPQKAPTAKVPIDWEQYDGESIASRYCDSERSDHNPHLGNADDEVDESKRCLATSSQCPNTSVMARDSESTESRALTRPGWGKSLLLWGKFSAAMMLAVSGAVIKGPGEMLKDVQRRSRDFTSESSCRVCGRSNYEPGGHSHRQGDAGLYDQLLPRDQPHRSNFDYSNDTPDHGSRSDTELDSSSLLHQVQQPSSYDSTLRPQQSPRRRVDGLFSLSPLPPLLYKNLASTLGGQS